MITLLVQGKEMIFSEQELTRILVKYFANEKKPSDGKWFEVEPLTIDQRLFHGARKDEKQEETRQFILEAFAELQRQPEKYGKNFQTLMLTQYGGSYFSIEKMVDMGCRLDGGDRMADWVEQSLEWAQRIANGETWEAICNQCDDAIFARLVVWKDGYVWRIGGSRCNDKYPASHVDCYSRYEISERFQVCDVPLMVRYSK